MGKIKIGELHCLVDEYDEIRDRDLLISKICQQLYLIFEPEYNSVLPRRKRPDLGFPPEYYEDEPKPEESRLLTACELDEIYVAKGKPYATADEIFDVGKTIAKVQLAKDMEWEDKNGFIKDAECQAKVERLFKEIEEHFFTFDGDGNLILCSEMDGVRKVNWWQALKKQEGIDGKD